MITYGAIFCGPVYPLIYKNINPTYLRLLKKLFGIKKWTKFKRTFISALVDSTVLNVPLSATSLGILGMLESKGNITTSYEKIVSQLEPTIKAKLLILPVPKAIIYGVFPQNYRPMSAMVGFGVVWKTAFSYIAHNY